VIIFFGILKDVIFFFMDIISEIFFPLIVYIIIFIINVCEKDLF